MSDYLAALLLFALLLIFYHVTTPRNGQKWSCGHWRFMRCTDLPIRRQRGSSHNGKALIKGTLLLLQSQPISEKIGSTLN